MNDSTLINNKKSNKLQYFILFAYFNTKLEKKRVENERLFMKNTILFLI